jgi:hypothetical protein
MTLQRSNGNDTSLVGYVRTTYDTLVKTFGQPHMTRSRSSDRVSCEWRFNCDGVVFTIYDWESGKTPMRHYDWHIGGHGDGADACNTVSLYLQGVRRVSF